MPSRPSGVISRVGDLTPLERSHVTVHWCAPMLGVDYRSDDPATADAVALAVARMRRVADAARRLVAAGGHDDPLHRDLADTVAALDEVTVPVDDG